MGLAFESQRNHIKKAVSSEGTAFFMEIFKKDLSISGAMEKILSISINLSRWIVRVSGFSWLVSFLLSV